MIAARAARLLYFLIRPIKFLILVLAVAVVKAEASFSNNDKLAYLRSGIHVKVIMQDTKSFNQRTFEPSSTHENVLIVQMFNFK